MKRSHVREVLVYAKSNHGGFLCRLRDSILHAQHSHHVCARLPVFFSP